MNSVKRKNVKREEGVMKGKFEVLVLLAVVLLLVAARPGPAQVQETLAVGAVQWSPVTICGPYHYYVGTDCGGEIWLDWGGWPSDSGWAGLAVEATGSLTVDHGCRVLEVAEVTICWPGPVGSGDKGD
jgi:hypothetical protein